MALKATIYKASLAVADMSRHHYQDYNLTLAQHPSETTERMMLRLLAFALCAHEDLTFGKGISDDDEAALYRQNLTGDYQLWIELGLPEEKRLRRASHKTEQLLLIAYGGTAVQKWYSAEQKALSQLKNLTIVAVSPAEVAELARLSDRTMQLQCSINEGQIWFGNAAHSVQVQPELIQQSTPALLALE
jgi:uncharacterized protein YaeQ